jgi:hypothetical protein
LRPTIYLTFDCEDFINTKSVFALYRILELLQKYDLKGIFFLTGHFAEKLSSFPHILNLLENHDIAYHGSSHSVRPTIFEYTDIEDYEVAKKISLERETSKINPLTGECEGKGGISLLRDLFPTKKIVSFRAPGFCWSPPHLEALKESGISFDFSTFFSKTPVMYEGVTFFPSVTLMDSITMLTYNSVFKSLAKSRFVVLLFHPSYFITSHEWDSIYFKGNPKKLYPMEARKGNEISVILRRFELFLKQSNVLQKSGIVSFTPPLEESRNELTVTMECVMKSYQESVSWAKTFFGYNPRFIEEHFKKFFKV